MHAVAERIFRAVGNHSARGRLNSNSNLRDVKPPRALIISTGEDIPRGQSIRARLLILELSKGDIPASALTNYQRDAADGLYAKAMGAFVQWISGRHEEVVLDFTRKAKDPRIAASEELSNAHARTADIVAQLQAAFEIHLELLKSAARSLPAGGKISPSAAGPPLPIPLVAQFSLQMASEPTSRFLRLISASLSSGRSHLSSKDGGAPDYAPHACGWRNCRRPTPSPGEPEPDTLLPISGLPLGDCIGWIDQNYIYLDPDAAYRQAQLMSREMSDPLPISLQTLEKRLFEKGLLASREEKRRTWTIQKTLAGSRKEVLHFLRETILPTDFTDTGDQEN